MNGDIQPPSVRYRYWAQGIKEGISKCGSFPKLGVPPYNEDYGILGSNWVPIFRETTISEPISDPKP